MNKTLAAAIVVIVVLVVLGGLAYYVWQQPQPTKNTGANNPLPENNTNNNTTIAVKKFAIDAKSFSFTPAEIRVNGGDRVKITLNNISGFHDFVLDEFNVKTEQFQGPGTREVEFIADKLGTFEYYCSVGEHRQKGMFGKLIVE